MARRLQDRAYALLESADLFKFAVTIKYEPSHVSSKRSITATVAVGVLTTIYLGITIGRFVNVSPVIKVSQRTSVSETHPCPDVAVAVQYGPMFDQFVRNETLVTMNATQWVALDANSRRESRSLRTSDSCSVGWAGRAAFEAFCPIERATLQGQLNSPRFQFLQLDLITRDIAGLLRDHNPRVFVYLRASDAEGEPRPQQLFQYPLRAQVPRMEIIMRAVQITTTPTYITSFSDQVQDVLVFVSERSYVQEVQEAGEAVEPGSPHVFMTLWVRLDETVLEEERRAPTIFDAISSVGALFSTLVGLLGLYFVSFNENTFYSQRPEFVHRLNDKRTAPAMGVPMAARSREVVMVKQGEGGTQTLNPLAE